MISIVIATYWLTVFHLARREAGTIVPMDAATARRPVTASSRPTITTTIHASILSMARSETSAAATSSLSAIGSSRVPRVVTWLRRRASMPSAQSVMAASVKIAAAITAWTREDEMRNTISRGTAMMRVRVRPIGKFTLELRGRESAWLLSGIAHDLVNVRHVPGHQRHRVQAQAGVHVGRPSGGDEPAGPGGVPLEAAHVAAVAPPRVQRVAGGLREHDPRRRREDPVDREAGARPILERPGAARAGAEDSHVAAPAGRPGRRRADVDQRRHADRRGGPSRQERARPVAGRE